MEHNVKNICRTIISIKEQDLTKHMAKLQFPYFFKTLFTFWPNSNLFKVLKTDFKIQYFFNAFNTAWEPCKIKKLLKKHNALEQLNQTHNRL